MRHQMTAVHCAVLKAHGPVLRFDQPVIGQGKRSDIPVVVNLFGTAERVAAGLGVSIDGLDGLGAFVAALRASAPPNGLRDALSRWPMLKAALATRPKLVGSALIQSVVQKGPRLTCRRCLFRRIGRATRGRYHLARGCNPTSCQRTGQCR